VTPYSTRSPAGSPDLTDAPDLGPGPDSELTWLLHRAAQRMRSVSGGAAAQHGLSLRDHIVLSALHLAPGMTQIELGRAVGMDKTTLTSELDRLEHAGLVERSVDPRDRRARTLAITARGEEVRSTVSEAAERAENQTLSRFTTDEIAQLRRMLFDLIGSNQDPGTCL
jgi:MarR family transcriptional regulator, organic hydroperoxide resistance regulator